MMSEFSFMRGWSQVQNKDSKAVRLEIMAALKLQTRMAFLQRLKGRVEPKVTEAKAIEEIFTKRGIAEIWGDALAPMNNPHF